MKSDRSELLAQLKAHYRSHGWQVKKTADGTLAADGPGGVTWIGAAVVEKDLATDDFEERLSQLAERRMPGSGELCPLDLLAASECEQRLRDLLDKLGLSRQPHVSVYSPVESAAA